MKTTSLIFLFIVHCFFTFGQELTWENKTIELHNVNASVVEFRGETVLRVERDLTKLPFDEKNLSGTVDQPTYVKLRNLYFTNGIIEVKVLSTIQNPSPFSAARGFIGLAYRINEIDTCFESIYLRPQLGRSDDQLARNHTVQYFSYPNFKFDRLRRESPGRFETYANIALEEWITLRLEVSDDKATLFINNQEHPSFIVADLKGEIRRGQIGLWVDIGTTGYFKDLKIMEK